MRGDGQHACQIFLSVRGYRWYYAWKRHGGGFIAESNVHGMTFLMFAAQRRYGVESNARNDTNKIYVL